MAYTLTEAASAVEKSKSTIQRAIKKGRISAQKNHGGQYIIEPSELHRIYPTQQTQRNATDATPVAQRMQRNAFSDLPHQKDRAQLLAEIADLRARLETIEQERERERELMQQQSELYRLRLEHADELLKQQTDMYASRLERYDRDKEQLTALLQDQRNKDKPSGVFAWLKRG